MACAATERIIKVKAVGGVQPTITIGYKGEYLARKVVFDVSELVTVFGDGAAIVLHKRNGDDAPYPCTISQDGTRVIWELTDVDTAIKGAGMAQLLWYVDDSLAKSAVFRTVTLDALTAGINDVPTAYETWLESLTSLAAAAQTAASNAIAAAEVAAKSAETVETYGTTVSEEVLGEIVAAYMDENPVTVETTDVVEQDNTLPVTSGGVYTVVGNIEALLSVL